MFMGVKINRLLVKLINEGSSIINFAWKQINSKNCCLMEINFKNGWTLQFTVNAYNYIVRKFNSNDTDNSTISILIETNKILLNKTNNLFIEFGKEQTVLKITNGYQINTIIDKLLKDPITIHIGNSRKRDACVDFAAAFGMKYNLFEWSMQNITYNPSVTPINQIRGMPKMMQFILMVILTNVILFVLSTAIYFLKRRTKHVSNMFYVSDILLNNQSRNIYEEQM